MLNESQVNLGHGIDSHLTVANGVTPVTIVTLPTAALGSVRDMTVIVNGAYALGSNGSFKANAAPNSYLEAWIEVQTVNDPADWRRITPSNDNFRLNKTDAHDCLVIDSVNAQRVCRVRVSVNIHPSATIDLDWQVIYRES